MRYHQQLRAEAKDVASDFFEASSVGRARVYRYMRTDLVFNDAKAVLPEPLPVHVLGREPVGDLWAMVGLRDTIERAWHREEKYFTRALEKEG